MSDWLEVLLKTKDVLNFVTTMHGAPSAMTVLMKMMQMLFVDSLAIQITVCIIIQLTVTYVFHWHR